MMFALILYFIKGLITYSFVEGKIRNTGDSLVYILYFLQFRNRFCRTYTIECRHNSPLSFSSLICVNEVGIRICDLLCCSNR